MLLTLSLFLSVLQAQAESRSASASVDSDVAGRIQSTRHGIQESEKQQREVLSHLFTLNKNIRDIAKKKARLNERLIQQEANVRSLAHDVYTLEGKSVARQESLNHRLRQLYQEQRQSGYQWLFTARSPVDLERNHHLLRKVIDSDHATLKSYIRDLKALREKRTQLKSMVARLAGTQAQMRLHEDNLVRQMTDKSRLVAELRKTKDSKVLELKDLRSQQSELGQSLSLAFFERRGSLKAPVTVAVRREYGAFVDPGYRFRLMHKGWFFNLQSPTEVSSIFDGKVVVARDLPLYGKTVIVDHYDNYYSVYAFLSTIKVREGQDIQEGQALALSGQGSPLFGPGLHFEIRHFADAIDPRPWIKEPLMKTADAH